MRLAPLLLALTTACSSCTKSPAVAKLPSQAAWPTMSLIGRTGLAHACPVGGYIVTAAHVMEGPMANGVTLQRSYIYQQGSRIGWLKPDFALKHRDLGFMKVSSGDTPLFHEFSDTFPLPGDRIHWYEYAYRKGVHLVKRRARVSTTVAGHLSFTPGPHSGASGGCIYNESGEVLAVITWGLGDGSTGLAPLVLGRFGPTP